MSQPCDVFISYNSLDKAEVLRLAFKLKDLGFSPWLDDWNLTAGEPWLPLIERALNDADACTVIVGKHGLGNVHQDEMWVALQRGIESKRGNRRFRVIPVLLPNSTRGDRMRLPKFLTANTWVEFQRSINEPAALDKLARAIRGQPPGAGAGLPNGQCPYRGLAYFDVQHSPLFFGREAQIDWLLSRLRGTATKEGPTRFVGIVGASGSGKSSLGRAGVLAKLKAGELPSSERWPLVICRPEGRPLESLATALSNADGVQLGTGLKATLIRQLALEFEKSPDQLHLVAQGAMPANDPDWRLVVFVDQFEELFTLNVAEAGDAQIAARSSALTGDRMAFVRNLLHAATIDKGRTIVILTMRADFYGKCATFPELATAVSQHQELVGPMTSDELRRAIEIPAQMSGSDIDAGLVDLLVSEVTGESGALPMLQYTLSELWKSSHDLALSKLTTTAYRELGGWEGTLSKRADEVFSKFKDTPLEDVCRQLFLRLVQPGEGTEDTKRLVHWKELQRNSGDDATLEQLIMYFSDNRLIVTSGNNLNPDSTIELVHEALIRSWPVLRQWLDSNREALRTFARLRDAARLWEAHDLDDDYLYHGMPLLEAEKCSQEYETLMTYQDQKFLNASVDKLVQSLANVETPRVGEVISELACLSRRAQPLLSKLLNESNVESRGRLHASLALLSSDANQVEFLRERLLLGELTDFAIVAQYLAPHRDALLEPLWAELEDEENQPHRRFRSAMGLAAYYRPVDDATNSRWHKCAAFIVRFQIDSFAWNPNHYATLAEAFRPVRKVLLGPLHALYLTEQDPAKQLWVAILLANFAADEPAKIFDLACDVSKKPFAVLFPHLLNHRDEVMKLADQELAQAMNETADELGKDVLAKRQANAAVTLFRLGETAKVWPLLKHEPDPRLRSYLLHRLGPLGADRQSIVTRLEEELDVSVKRALILSLGETWHGSISLSDQSLLVERILAILRDDPDPGIHGAAEWILRRRNQETRIPDLLCELATGKREGGRQWYVTRHGDTFVCLRGPTEFRMGSPSTEPDRAPNETLHKRVIDGSFAIASKLVTVERFGQFQQENPDVLKVDIKRYAPDPDCPQVTVSWYDGAAYCNWLSEREGFPKDQWCYEPNAQGKYADGMKTARDYLQRAGYRFPTEAEWEYACRANALTSRFYGQSEELLVHYAWYQKNSHDRTQAVGSLKPNDFGLFDMLGNAWEWCDDRYRDIEVDQKIAPMENVGASAEITDERDRVLRGGSYNNNERNLRSAYRNCDSAPDTHYDLIGFRVARTLI
jgi:formylglycine-generating enzyme required for sulfatase activity